MTNNRAGVREIQKTLKMVSSGTASHQINKLVTAGIISKNRRNIPYKRIWISYDTKREKV